MRNYAFLFLIFIVLVNCGVSKSVSKTNTRMEKDDAKSTLGITRVITAHTDSGTLNGSLPKKQALGMDHHYYTNYDVTNDNRAGSRKEFDEVLVNFLDQTKVCGLISVRAYLQYTVDNNTVEINKIQQARRPRPKGNALIEHDILLFSSNADEPEFRIPLNYEELTGEGVSGMYRFLGKNGASFSSNIPDELFMKYYGKQ